MKIIVTFLSTLAVVVGFVPVHQMESRKTTTLQMSEGLKTGYVKWFDTAKGFGFIVPDDGSGDVFVHQTAINVQGFRSLAEDERVEFRTEADQNGRIRALDVTGPDGADVKGAPYPSNNDFDEW